METHNTGYMLYERTLRGEIEYFDSTICQRTQEHCAVPEFLSKARGKYEVRWKQTRHALPEEIKHRCESQNDWGVNWWMRRMRTRFVGDGRTYSPLPFFSLWCSARWTQDPSRRWRPLVWNWSRTWTGLCDPRFTTRDELEYASASWAQTIHRSAHRYGGSLFKNGNECELVISRCRRDSYRKKRRPLHYLHSYIHFTSDQKLSMRFVVG